MSVIQVQRAECATVVPVQVNNLIVHTYTTRIRFQISLEKINGLKHYVNARYRPSTFYYILYTRGRRTATYKVYRVYFQFLFFSTTGRVIVPQQVIIHFNVLLNHSAGKLLFLSRDSSLLGHERFVSPFGPLTIYQCTTANKLEMRPVTSSNTRR